MSASVPPPNLTRTERAIYQLLAESPGTPIHGAEIYARVTNTPIEWATNDSARVHINNMRRKGCQIANKKMKGYWLELIPAENVRAGREMARAS